MKISFKRVEKGHYKHEDTGVEIQLKSNEWVVTEPVGGGSHWISTRTTFQAARADAVTYVEPILEWRVANGKKPNGDDK